ncbi:MAG TPA: pyridoxal-phosphate dependent enzyme [Candidatus Dormibacteraeota bacterium]|nr:pyridoxal-phosphate dependent enzyme [Candidatus Dormibacteraeota bacterium]
MGLSTVAPRVRLASLPTPLVRLARLERELAAPPLYCKRDDLCGFALAGNKTRALEFLVGEALVEGCDVLVTGGGPASSYCQGAAAAAAVTGIGCTLVLYGDEPPLPHPNLVLARRFGATVRFTGDPRRESVDAGIEAAAAELRAAGHRPYAIPRGGARAVAVLGYAAAAAEALDQLDAAGVEPALMLVATGSGVTHAGLLAGLAASRRPLRVVGAAVSRPPGETATRVLALAAEGAALLGAPPPAAAAVEVHDARGPGYGVPSEEGERAAAVAAAHEGLILDPAFTAKAFGLLPTLLATGDVGGPVVLWHTGGTAVALAPRAAGADL